MNRLASVGKLDGVIHGEDGHLDRPSLIFCEKQILVAFIMCVPCHCNLFAKNEAVQMTKCLKAGQICLQIKLIMSWMLIALKSLAKCSTVTKKLYVHR